LTDQRWTARFVPSRALGDLFGRPWMEGAVPIILAVILGLSLALIAPGVTTSYGLQLILIQFAQIGFLALGLTVVMVGGGIDLSVGSIAGASALTSLVLFRSYNWSPIAIVPAVLVLGAVLGAVNGLLTTRAGIRPLIATLVTGVVYQALIEDEQAHYVSRLVSLRSDTIWNFLGNGKVAGLQVSVFVFLIVLIVAQIGLTRSRWGWRVLAVGSNRRSARRNGISPNPVIFSTYVLSGILCAAGGLFYGANQQDTSDQLTAGWTIIALTAVVVGGVSLRGGRGTAIRAALGMLVISLLSYAIIVLNIASDWQMFALGAALLIFASADHKWGKYRNVLAGKLAFSPALVRTAPLEDITSPDSRWRINAILSDAEPIGLGQVEGGEDCILDSQGRLYCGDRRGWIWRFSGPKFEDAEMFCRTGGLPLGLAFDRDGNLLAAVVGMGVVMISPDGSMRPIATHVHRRSFRHLYDDSAIMFPDDLDVAPDGSVYFSEVSTRLMNAGEMQTEMLECRPNGRVLRYDPQADRCEVVVRNCVLPNGIATAHDGRSILIASTGLCRVDRLWISGPEQGRLEPVLTDLPGHIDNINRASDGNYWLTFVGMRTPMFDLLLKYPRVRHRMLRELPLDDWVTPQFNVSCVVKFSEAGEILSVMWDSSLEKHPMVTSMREQQGYLYLGGLQNNRIGRVLLPAADVGTIDPIAVPGSHGSFLAGVRYVAHI
jgi:ribose transport system permease protein